MASEEMMGKRKARGPTDWGGRRQQVTHSMREEEKNELFLSERRSECVCVFVSGRH